MLQVLKVSKMPAPGTKEAGTHEKTGKWSKLPKKSEFLDADIAADDFTKHCLETSSLFCRSVGLWGGRYIDNAGKGEDMTPVNECVGFPECFARLWPPEKERKKEREDCSLRTELLWIFSKRWPYSKLRVNKTRYHAQSSQKLLLIIFTHAGVIQYQPLDST